MTENEKEIEQNESEEHKTFRKRLIVIPTIIAIIAVAIYIIVDATMYQSTDDAYIESHMVQIAPRVSGQIEDVYIDDNQKVKEGDIIARIDDTDYKVKLDETQANYSKALLSQSVAKANLRAVNSEITLAKKDLDRYTNLYEAGAVSKQTLDAAQTKYDGIKAKQLTAEEQILSSAQNKVADADLKALKSKRDKAALDLQYTTIKAPRTGTVTNKKVEKGAYVQVGQPLFAVVPDNVWVIANFKENQIGAMRVGQSVDIKVDTYPNKVFKGKIDSIQRASGAKSSLFPPENAVGSFVKIVQRVPVKIVFDEPIDTNKYNIVSGMSVIPKVKVK